MSVVPYGLMINSGESGSVWVYLVRLTPGIVALVSGMIKRQHVKHILCRTGAVRFWFVAAMLPPLVEAVTVAIVLFLQMGVLDRTFFAGNATQAVHGAIQLPFSIGNGSLPAVSLLSTGALAAVLYFPLALGEELGWRGVGFARCGDRFGVLWGSMAVGLIWGIWQLPAALMRDAFDPGSAAFFSVRTLVSAIAFSVVLGYLYEQSGSLWVPALMHGSLNAANGLHVAVLVEPHSEALIEMIWIGLWFIVAETILWHWAKSDKQAPAEPEDEGGFME